MKTITINNKRLEDLFTCFENSGIDINSISLVGIRDDLTVSIFDNSYMTHTMSVDSKGRRITTTECFESILDLEAFLCNK